MWARAHSTFAQLTGPGAGDTRLCRVPRVRIDLVHSAMRGRGCGVGHGRIGVYRGAVYRIDVYRAAVLSVRGGARSSA